MGNGKFWAVAIIATILVGAGLAETLGFIDLTPVWPPPFPGQDGKPVFKVVDGISDAAFSPADASVKMYDPGIIVSMPGGNVQPFSLIDACSESPDGEFTSTASVLIGKVIYVYISGTNYYTAGFFVTVPDLASGTSGECESVILKVYPNSGTIGNDIAAMFTSGGVEIDSTSTTSNVSFGAASYKLDLTAADGYGFGNNNYVDPETGYLYVGTFAVFSLDLTTARATITSAHIPSWGHFTISSIEYWILLVPGGQIINDDDIAGDGTVTLNLEIDVTVGVASAALDIEFYTVRRIDQMIQGSFGTSYEADDIDDLYLNTS